MPLAARAMALPPSLLTRTLPVAERRLLPLRRGGKLAEPRQKVKVIFQGLAGHAGGCGWPPDNR